jgi:O-antigen/teichoic acid export membrane protein
MSIFDRIRRRLKPSDDTRAVISNGTWSAFQQTLTMAANSGIALLLVLVLPVSQYGVYSYAVALCAIGVSIMTGGLGGLAVKMLVHDRENGGRVVRSLLLIRESLAVIAYVVIGLVSLTSGSITTVAATLVASIALLGRAMDAPELWYRAEMRSKNTALIRLSSTAVFFSIRLAALVLWPHIWLFLALYAAESVAAGIAIFVRFRRDKTAPRLQRSKLSDSFGMLKDSVPLMASGVANQINLRADIVVLQAMMGSASVGIYSAAARMSELAYFLPVVYMNATLPVLLKTRKEYGPDHKKYKNMLQRSYDQSFWVGVAIAFIVALVGTFIIDFMFGPEYEQSKYVLYIHLAACPFVFMAAVYSKWIIAEGYLWSSLVRHSIGAIINVGANILLIPVLGVVGSALATVLSYVAASYFACFIGAKSREAGMQMTLAMAAPARLMIHVLRRK